MKNIKSMLQYCRLISKFGYHNIIQFMNLKKIDDLSGYHHELYTGLSDSTSKLQLRIGSQYYYNYITYSVYDTELDKTVAVFSEGSSTGLKTVLYPTWARVSPFNDDITVYDFHNEEQHYVIGKNLGEDQHFQLMMERNMPEFEDLEKVIQYLDEVRPTLSKYSFHSLVEYDNLDVDLSLHIPNTTFLEEMDYQFNGSYDLYNTAEER